VRERGRSHGTSARELFAEWGGDSSAVRRQRAAAAGGALAGPGQTRAIGRAPRLFREETARSGDTSSLETCRAASAEEGIGKWLSDSHHTGRHHAVYGETLQKGIERHLREGFVFSMAFLDLEPFKRSRHYGHPAVTRYFGVRRTVRGHLGPEDVWGVSGARFILFFPGRGLRSSVDVCSVTGPHAPHSFRGRKSLRVSFSAELLRRGKRACAVLFRRTF
jgi:hypothetical protein